MRDVRQLLISVLIAMLAVGATSATARAAVAGARPASKIVPR